MNKDLKNFETDKTLQYEKCQKEKNCSLEKAFLKVNMDNHLFYTQIRTTENPEAYTVLVNKYHSLEEYEPKDLKNLSYDSKYKLREKAALAFEELVKEAKKDQVFICPYSAYRSFAYQTKIYNEYVKKDGQEAADTYSARPGHSEHQTGLAVDVWTEGYETLLEKEAKWLEENAHKYGFIVRYTKEKQNITGYIAEPWHLRYLGKNIAKDVVEKNLSYDEYYNLYIK